MSGACAPPNIDGFVTRLAEAADLDVVAGLLLATNRHYWGPRDGAEAATRRAAEDLVHGRAGCNMLLGWLDGTAVAYATFAVMHPAPSEHGTLFMKDLFVVEAARGKGLGEIMMRRLAALAVARGCVRFDWTAETDNPRALDFYDRLAAARVTDKVYFRFAGDDLARFAEPPAAD